MAGVERVHVLRRRRHARLRHKVVGTADRPRLAVFRSKRHIVAQVIDDAAGRTIVAASTMEAGLRSQPTGNVAAAAEVGRLVAARAQQAGIAKVVFDRGGSRYHGRVAALAEAARQAGLEF
ncbi:MAG TPA: 50S ribosomal protein L18 [Acidimicrobiales bacterium]|nr:50S ribosomal protein L18 [Acidimicrobiales bacterium]